MKTANVVLPMDAEKRKDLESILEPLGTNLTSVLENFINRIQSERKVPFGLVSPKRPLALDEMSDEEFDSILQEGLDQIEKGEHEPFQDAIANIKLETASWKTEDLR